MIEKKNITTVENLFEIIKQKYKLILIIIFIVIILFILLNRLFLKPVSINQISPNPDSQIFDLKQEIKISFNNLSEKDLLNISIVTNPQVQVTLKWSSEKILTIIPNYWVPGRTHNINVNLYGQNLANYSFQVKKFDDLTEEEITYLATRDIEKTSVIYEKLYAQKPWLKKLPIFSDLYKIVYDYEKNNIRIRILNTKNLDEVELNSLRIKSIDELLEIDVPREEIDNIDFIYE